jgi:hypothetical protein
MLFLCFFIGVKNRLNALNIYFFIFKTVNIFFKINDFVEFHNLLPKVERV